MPQTRDLHVPRRTLGTFTAALLVVADMIGTGVFTTSGFLIRDIGSGPAVVWAWILGGLVAFCGAQSYAELAAVLPHNGGEYRILSRVFHPVAGFLAGWISLLVGFSAPVAAASLAFGHYLASVFPGIPPLASAASLIVVLATLHGLQVRLGAGAQNVFTVAKILLIGGMAVAGLAWGEAVRVSDMFSPDPQAFVSPGFAVGLIYISFSYSGWNGAVYLAGEVQQPDKSLPRALLLGTGFVTLLYAAINLAFLAAAPTRVLSGVVQVGHVAATYLFGPEAATVFAAAIAVMLVSSVSAMTMAGPRVYQAMGADHARLGFLARQSRHGAPWVAVVLQAGVALVLLFSFSFELLLTYAGFMLSVSCGMAVLGVMWLRHTEPQLVRPYRVSLYPLEPVVFLLFSAWMVTHAILERPLVAVVGGLTLLAGLIVYRIVVPPNQRGHNQLRSTLP